MADNFEDRLNSLEDRLNSFEDKLDRVIEMLSQQQFMVQSINDRQSYDISNNTHLKDVMSRFLKEAGSFIDSGKKSVKKPKPPKSIDDLKPSTTQPNGAKSVYVTMCKDLTSTFSEEIAIVAHKLYNTYEATREYTDYMDIYAKVFDPKLDEEKIPEEFLKLRYKYLDEYDARNAPEEEQEEVEPPKKAKSTASVKQVRK